MAVGRAALALCVAAAALHAAEARAADTEAPFALDRLAVDAKVEARVLALDPERLSARDVSETLARVPAPRIIALQGSVPLITMTPFAEFLIAMGYPEERIRNPRDGALSYSSHVDARALAGTLAWYDEHEGIMPMLIGHSQGGMIAIKVLHELAGSFGDAIPVWNPLRAAAEARTTIVDPLMGRERPVVGLKVPYAAALATGKLPRLLLGQWSMLSRLQQIPDTVEDFTGFSFSWDPIAGNFGHAEPYRATGSARVRNVLLPARASHITLPRADALARNPATREWIERYFPGTTAAFPDVAVDTANLLHAADIWYSVKKHWCIEAQRLLRARRGDAGRG
ncbi:MAG TPA: hypothetical protein VL742_08940 [Casimicrobiaceae bacterium]|nr:hypothetical protein [Casimicrobiaceae bacterium]